MFIILRKYIFPTKLTEFVHNNLTVLCISLQEDKPRIEGLTEVIVTNAVIKGYHVYQVKPPLHNPPVRLLVDLEYTNIKDPNASLVWMPALDYFNESLHDIETDEKRHLYLKDIAGLPVGHVPWGLSAAFSRLLKDGFNIYAQPLEEPLPSFPPWPNVKEKGGGIVIPANYIIQCSDKQTEKVLEIVREAIDKMPEKSAITVTIESCLKEEQRSSNPKRRVPPNYPDYNIIRKEVGEGREIDSIRGDGNCFFRAVSKAICGSEENHKQLRDLCVEFLNTHSNQFRQFVDDDDIQAHMNAMRKLGTWATQCEIFAAATILQRDIYVLSPAGSSGYKWYKFTPQIPCDPATLDRCFITLSHTQGNHYDCIFPKDKVCNCGQRAPMLKGSTTHVEIP